MKLPVTATETFRQCPGWGESSVRRRKDFRYTTGREYRDPSGPGQCGKQTNKYNNNNNKKQTQQQKAATIEV